MLYVELSDPANKALIYSVLSAGIILSYQLLVFVLPATGQVLLQITLPAAL